MRAVRVINTPPAKPLTVSIVPPPEDAASRGQAGVSPHVLKEEQAYQAVLETLRTQRLVIDTLNDTLQRHAPPEPLKLDVGTVTEAFTQEGAITLVAKAERAAELRKWQLRREAANSAYARRLALLQDDLQNLRKAALEVESSKQQVHVQGVAREGPTREVR